MSPASKTKLFINRCESFYEPSAVSPLLRRPLALVISALLTPMHRDGISSNAPWRADALPRVSLSEPLLGLLSLALNDTLSPDGFSPNRVLTDEDM